MPRTSPIVYLEYRPVPAELGPCHVARGERVTLLYVDPRVTCRAASTWIIENLSRPEQNYIRAAYGVPPVGQGGDPDWVSDRPVGETCWVPDLLCPPDALRSVQEAQPA